MTALLTDNLPLLAGAPNGIKKLRELILELAVRGKLVPQDPNDEPASELLKRIAEEKTRLVVEGKIKKQKPLAKIEDQEKPFVIPTDWEWVRLDSLLKKIGAGSTPLGGKQAYVAKGVKFLRSQNVWNEGLRLNDVAFIPEATHQKMSGTHVEAGDLLFNITGASIGRCAAVPSNFDTGNVSQHVTIIRPVSSNTQPFLHVVLVSQLVQQTVMDVQVGVSREGLSIGKLSQFLIPFPPEAEQHRIVAKVDELMALCDRLEAQQADAESAHAQLVQALLDSLTQAADAEDFAASWQRLAEHFHTLFTTESSIDALKQSLLQLAVMGKLVPQDPSEEPASELLKRIAKEKARLVAEGKIRKTKQLPEITDNDKLASTPNGWESVRFGQVIELISGQHLGPDEYFESIRDGAIPYLTGPADFGETYPRPTRFTNERRATSIKGDILLTVKGAGVGKTNFVDQDEFAISRQLMAIRPIIVDAQFARNMLLSMSAHFHSKSIGIAIPGISREDVLDTLIGIPPLPEQRRIVAKVDQLMALCDQLKNRLTKARQLNEQLTTSLVEQAVA
ncbi:restriction endonuclease subunit S [Pseudomonas kunmingensis]|uniref:restriction endonuclease subunit S n=1 Tax=Stutzerimonas kunmingensis TaxID=1211807 RepID=UPI0015E40D72|nr:restriction endonuclease subunit S [Stutzerimonas kunmingensis]MBA1238989.1 restriction endonuclease subunit S [Stutzerimonas kunmingensis]MDH2246685.1 restriction endonuclease subunit S [Pseudomonas sp. GD03856]MDH2265156.1 restriction endonuclease subunit S [Pseudomonas sp. GD03855]